jgi:hypothetical protein
VVRPKEGELSLLDLKPFKGTDNFGHRQQLPIGILPTEVPAFDPAWIALSAQSQLAFGFGNLLLKGDHRIPFVRKWAIPSAMRSHAGVLAGKGGNRYCSNNSASAAGLRDGKG